MEERGLGNLGVVIGVAVIIVLVVVGGWVYYKAQKNVFLGGPTATTQPSPCCSEKYGVADCENPPLGTCARCDKSQADSACSSSDSKKPYGCVYDCDNPSQQCLTSLDPIKYSCCCGGVGYLRRSACLCTGEDGLGRCKRLCGEDSSNYPCVRAGLACVRPGLENRGKTKDYICCSAANSWCLNGASQDIKCNPACDPPKKQCRGTGTFINFGRCCPADKECGLEGTNLNDPNKWAICV